MALQIKALWLRKTVQRLGSKEKSIQLFVIHSDISHPSNRARFPFSFKDNTDGLRSDLR